MRVLILGARAPACLEWARAFAQAGWAVTVADSLAMPLSRFSRAAEHFVQLPEPKTNPNAWVEALAQVVRQRRIDLLLPTCEEVFYLAHGLARLQPLCRVFTSDFDCLQRLHHKGQFAALTEGWSVAAPPTEVLHDAAAVQARAHERDALVFKPAYSRFATHTLVRPSPAQLAKVRPNALAPWVAQRFVAGQEYCSFSVLVDGQLRAHASYQPRYRVGRGSGIYFASCAPAPIRAFVSQFGNATGYTGQVGFDFIEDAQGRFHVLECNPRATSGVHLFDDQRTSLVAALGQTADGVLQATLQPRMIGLAMLLLAAPKRALQRRFWHDLGNARDVIVQDGDRGPLTAQWLSLAEIVGRAATRRCGLLAAATADIEWNGEPLPGGYR